MFCEEKKVFKKRLKKKRGDAEQHTACRLLRDSTRSVLHNATRQCTHCRWDVTLYLPVHSLSVICYYTPQYI